MDSSESDSPEFGGSGRRLTNRMSRLYPWRWGAKASTWLVFLATFAYIAAMMYTAFMKYYSFNDTFQDLGIGNQILWLLSHGGVANYNHSGFANIYPMQWQKPIIFVVLPFYALDPHAITLLAIQSIVLGLPAVPIYYLGRKLLQGEWLPAVIAVSYLAFFPVASANLFDFQFENFAPLCYVLMALAWESRRPRWSAFAGAFCAAVNPLTLIMVFFFFLFTLLRRQGLPFHPMLALRRAMKALPEDVPRLVLLVALPAVIGLYALAGSLYTAGAGGGSGAGGGILHTLAFAINDKFMLALFLFGAVCFLPLYEPWFLWLVAPYIGWVFYSEDASHWAIFGLMYPVLAAGPVFYCVILALARVSPFAEKAPLSLSVPASAATAAITHYPSLAQQWSISPRTERALPFAAVTLAFALVYLPWSPLNQDVQGGYFSGDHSYGSITTITPNDKFLWSVINLIPASASVLSQNGIPQVSGREYDNIDTLYNSSIPYDYILADTNITLFTSFATIAPFVSQALANGTFGVVAEGYGAILLERGYAGPPKLFAPYAADLNGDSLTAYSGTRVAGTSLVRDTSGYSMWYGPYATLFPGNYSATFQLEVNSTTSPNASVVTLEVSENDGAIDLRYLSLVESNFTNAGEPSQFVLSFSVTNLALNVEFRGMAPGGHCLITLDGVLVSQSLMALR